MGFRVLGVMLDILGRFGGSLEMRSVGRKGRWRCGMLGVEAVGTLGEGTSDPWSSGREKGKKKQKSVFGGKRTRRIKI